MNHGRDRGRRRKGAGRHRSRGRQPGRLRSRRSSRRGGFRECTRRPWRQESIMTKSAGMFKIQVTVDDAVNSVITSHAAHSRHRHGPSGRSMANPTLAEAQIIPGLSPRHAGLPYPGWIGAGLRENEGGYFGIWPRQGKAKAKLSWDDTWSGLSTMW